VFSVQLSVIKLAITSRSIRRNSFLKSKYTKGNCNWKIKESRVSWRINFNNVRRVFSHTRQLIRMNLRFPPITLLFFLVIQRASEPLCFISLPCYSARIRSVDDLWDRSDPPTVRSDAPTCGCTREYDKSRRIWARNAYRVPFETGRTSRANVCSFSRTSSLSCIRWSMILQWQSLLAVNRCNVVLQLESEESIWWARSTSYVSSISKAQHPAKRDYISVMYW